MSNPSMLPVAALAAFEAGVNQLLALDPETFHRLRALQGRVIAVEVNGVAIRLYLVPMARGLHVTDRWEGEPDAVLRGAPSTLMAAAAGGRPAAGEVEIRGDVELGREVQRILAQLEIDWEEQLSRLTGDIVAHQAGNAARQFSAWLHRAGETLRRDLGEYLQEERQVVPHPTQMETFLAQIDTLRDDVERLSARLQRLEARLHDKSKPKRER